MKKVALLTIHMIPNCGSLLQAWATIQCVEKFGCACTLVDYDFPTWHHQKTSEGDEHKSQSHAGFKHFMLKLGLLGLAQRVNFLRHRYFIRRRTKAFWTKFSLTPKCDYRTVGEITGYDIYLTGSDQTWNPRYMGDDHSFLLDFTPDSARRISYAASFGCRELPSDQHSTYGRLLSRYAAISVREPSGVKIVQDLCGKESQAVVDPTLLLTPRDYVCLMGDRLPQGKRFVFCYVLSYVFDAGEWAVKLAVEVARAMGVGVIFYAAEPAMAKRARAAGFEVWTGFLTVADFLECYGKAEFVITTSFHGTAFSLNFRKNFYSILNPNASADDRVASFLTRFGLGARGVLPGSDVGALAHDLTVDYSEADGRLAAEREKSMAFLKQALGGGNE